MNLRVLTVVSLLGVVAVACSSSNGGSGFGASGSSGTSGTSGSSGTSGTSGLVTTDGGTSGGPAACAPAAGNYDFPGNNCDDDNDGTVDNPPAACDTSLAVAGNASDFARAMGLCSPAFTLSAQYLRGAKTVDSPNASQHGILGKFGTVLKPREGSSLGVISTGFAREYNASSGKAGFNNDDTGQGLGQEMGSGAPATIPNGFPKSAQGCPSLADGAYDAVNVKLKLKAPNNAKGFSFDFNFMSSEWPQYVCSSFNDSFIAYLTSKATKGDNISFDSKKNPVSVNLGFLDRCTPNVEIGCCADRPQDCAGTPKGTSQCAGGAAELAGTGFGITGNNAGGSGDRNALRYCKNTSTGGASTGWLTTTSPIEPGEEFTLEFMIWDTGDGVFDSSALLDNFQWIQGVVSNETVRPK